MPQQRCSSCWPASCAGARTATLASRCRAWRAACATCSSAPSPTTWTWSTRNPPSCAASHATWAGRRPCDACFACFFADVPSRDEAKKRCTAIVFGSSDKALRLAPDGQAFAGELATIRSRLLPRFLPLVERIAQRKDGGHGLPVSDARVHRSAMAQLLQTVENAVLQRVIYVMQTKHGRVALANVYDGAPFLRKPDAPLMQAVLDDLAAEVARCCPLPPEVVHWDSEQRGPPVGRALGRALRRQAHGRGAAWLDRVRGGTRRARAAGAAAAAFHGRRAGQPRAGGAGVRA